MKCKNCGAAMLDTDQFCIQCGWKAGKPLSCPDCGEALREGARFCPKCGRLIAAHTGSEERSNGAAGAETTDIPIVDIEQNILRETQREIGSAGMPGASKPQARKSAAVIEEELPRKRRDSVLEEELPRKRRAEIVEEELPRKRKAEIVEEELSRKRKWNREDDIEDEEEEEYDVYEEDDEDEEDGGHRLVTIMTVVMAVLIFLIMAFIVFRMFVMPGKENYDVDEEYTEEGEAPSQEDGSAEGQGGGSGEVSIEESGAVLGTLSIDTNVNVRDNPSTSGTNVIKVAKAGETYEYVGMSEDGNWYCIVLEDGSTGYVFRDYVIAD